MKKFIILLVFILLGSVLGAFVASTLSDISFLKWLSFGGSVGFMADSPLILDLMIVRIAFGIEAGINVAQIIFILMGVLGFVLLSKKL